MEVARPQSEEMMKYQADMNAKAVENGLGMSPIAAQVLQGIAKTQPDYRRNRTKICTFFLKGTCNRGEACPFRHEQPDHTDVTLASQNIKDRYFGTSDVLAQKILDRVHDPKNAQTSGPEVSTVWISGVLPEKKITEQDLKDHFYSFGEIVSIRLVPASKCAFVEFVNHDEANRAIEALRNNLVIRGQFLKVGWAKAQTEEQRARRQGARTSEAAANTAPPPPPGFVPYHPMAPGAPPPGAAGPLGWAPMYYPSMNPQRMGSVVPSSSENKEKTSKSRPDYSVEHPDDDTKASHGKSRKQHSESSVSVSEVEDTAASGELPQGGRVKRSGGAEGAAHDSRPGNSKKAKV